MRLARVLIALSATLLLGPMALVVVGQGYYEIFTTWGARSGRVPGATPPTWLERAGAAGFSGVLAMIVLGLIAAAWIWASRKLPPVDRR